MTEEQSSTKVSAKQSLPKKKFWHRFLVNIDLSNRKHRRWVLIGLFVFSIFFSAFAYTNYKVYEYTESAEFCGGTCHVMEPHFIRYEGSAHANVECVECHIGSGFKFYVRAKWDGLKQVYAVATDSYELPIRGPVHNLRPARETCETCHSPANFKDNVLKTVIHYDNDETNTQLQSTLMLRMGGWNESTGVSEGIHWHITNPVYYIAADEQRQSISWVGIEQPDGELKEYYSRDMANMAQTSFVEDAYANDEVRLMDCIDCHNRTAHEIPSPQAIVDNAIYNGIIAKELPYIRTNAVKLLSNYYESEDEAYLAIDELTSFYEVASLPQTEGGETAVFDTAQIPVSINAIKEIYSVTNFPELELDWTTSPNNARHTPTLGCFRCHDDKHITVDENEDSLETISVKCNLCHTVPIIGRGDELLVESPIIGGDSPESHIDFRWTIEHRDITEADKKECYQCHGQAFCNNGICHSLSHPPDMLFTHAQEYRLQGDQNCYTCHQDILCSRCHPGGIIVNP